MNNKVLEIENNEKILSFRNTFDEPIWMYMRYSVLYTLMQSKYFGEETVQSSRGYGHNAIIYLVKSLFHNFRAERKDKEVLFYTAHRGVLKENVFLNQYTDDYANLIDDQVITIEDAPLNWEWYKERAFDNYYYFAIPYAISTVLSKFINVDLQETEALMSFVDVQLKNIFDINLTKDEKEHIVKSTCAEMHKMHLHAKWLAKLCKKSNIKTAIIVGGSYSWYACIIKKLKELGIVVADLQHGYITKSNVVYNYADAIVNTNDIRESVPDYLLTYGKWWNNQTNIPYKEIVELGNPYRTNNLKNFNYGRTERKMMLVGCARNTQEYILLANRLTKLFPNYNVVFRPHPTERYEVKRWMEKNECNFQIDLSHDLYSSLETIEVVISEISTVIFESINLVPKIIVWRTNYSKYILEECPFHNFENPEELIGIINDYNPKELDLSMFWEKEWKANFMSFIKKEDLS